MRRRGAAAAASSYFSKSQHPSSRRKIERKIVEKFTNKSCENTIGRRKIERKIVEKFTPLKTQQAFRTISGGYALLELELTFERKIVWLEREKNCFRYERKILLSIKIP